MSDSLPLHTIVDPAFGLLGSFLLLLGLPLAFIGHRSQWYTCASTGFYSTSLIVLTFILRFGQARAITDPSWTTRGLFLLASLCGGLLGAIIAIVFRQGALLLTNALGGFAFALFVQACKANGLIERIEMRFILYVVTLTIFFILGCISRIHLFVQIISTAIIGTTATVLGVDCFTRAGLKEFYVRNIGFDDLFEKRYPDAFSHDRFPLSTGMVIELGVLGGVTCMAISMQGKMWVKLKQSMALMRQQDAERQTRDEQGTSIARKIFVRAQRDLRRWKASNGEPISITVGENREFDEDATLASDKPPRVDFMRSDKSFENTLRSSIALPLSDASPSSDRLSSLLVQDARPTQSNAIRPTLPVNDGRNIDDKVKLLEEIAAIRKSICELRSATDKEAQLVFPARAAQSVVPPALHTRRWTMSDALSTSPQRPLSLPAFDAVSRGAEAGPKTFSVIKPVCSSFGRHTASTSCAPDQHQVVPSPLSLPSSANSFDRRTSHIEPRQNPPPTHMPRERRMTSEELQVRHSKRLSQMQRPLSMQLNEVAALERAKEEWELRKAQERRYWQQKHHRRHHHQ